LSTHQRGKKVQEQPDKGYVRLWAPWRQQMAATLQGTCDRKYEKHLRSRPDDDIDDIERLRIADNKQQSRSEHTHSTADHLTFQLVRLIINFGRRCTPDGRACSSENDCHYLEFNMD